jgi:hypothetical protein
LVFELEAPMLARCLLHVAEDDRAPFLDAFATLSRVQRQESQAESGLQTEAL